MSRFSLKILLAIFSSGYFGTIVITTTAPLYLDTTTSSYLIIGPLIFIILVGSYLVVRSLHLRGFFKLVAYFIAFIALVNLPSAVFATSGSTQTSLPVRGLANPLVNNSTIRWAHDFRDNCLLVAGQSSTRHWATGYYAVGYGAASSNGEADCHGNGQLTDTAYSSGVYAGASVDSSIWFEDQSFYVPPNSQRTTVVYVSGNIFMSGWLADHRSGLGSYDPNTDLKVEVRLAGDAPCTVFDCVTNYFDLWWWDETQSVTTGEYSIQSPGFELVPGYNYHLIVSFNESSGTFAAGLGGLASADACFGQSPDCLHNPDTFPGDASTCAQTNTNQSPCGLDLESLSYTLTSYS